MTDAPPNPRWRRADWLLLALVLAVGLLVRLDDLAGWLEQPERAMHAGEPLLANFDGYHYLRLARELVDGTYARLDVNRSVPDGDLRPPIPPLLSVSAAAVAKVSGYSLNWIGAVLPAAFGVLLALPLFAWGRLLGGTVAGFTAALLAILSPYYVGRSGLGWFDTDCLNVTLTIAAAYCFMRFGTESSRRRYSWCAMGLVVYGLFLWWWDTTPQVVTAISLAPLALALAVFYRPPRREAVGFLAGLAALAMLALGLGGTDRLARLLEAVAGTFSYVTTGAMSGIWPGIGLAVSEQKQPSFEEIVTGTTNGPLGFGIAIAGLAWLLWRHPRQWPFLAVPVALAALPFFFAARFLIFVAPVAALGAGFLIADLWRRRHRFAALSVVAPALLAAAAGPPLYRALTDVSWPAENPRLIAGMALASRETPEDAVIWAWWDHGYPLAYWSRRATVADGTYHAGEQSIYNGLPFTTDDQRLAANFMRFYVSRGMAGIGKVYAGVGGDPGRGITLIKDVLSAGPALAPGALVEAGMDAQGELQTIDDWVRFFYPPPSRPIFILLDWRLSYTNFWWYWLGSWDPRDREGVHPSYRIFHRVERSGRRITGKDGMSVDVKNGILRVDDEIYRLTHLLEFGASEQVRRYRRQEGGRFEVHYPGRFAALMDGHIAESVFNQLFLRHLFHPRYFRPVVDAAPLYQLWEVIGDAADDERPRDDAR